MTWYPIQRTFQYGQVGQGFYSQTDSPIYQAGLAECYNMLPTPQGGLVTRAGFGYDTTILENYSGDARVIPIDIVADDRVIAVLTEYQLHLQTTSDFIRQGNFVKNYDFRNGDADWTVFRSSYNSQGEIVSDKKLDSFPWEGYATARAYQGASTGWYGYRQKVAVVPVEGGLTLKYFVAGPASPDYEFWQTAIVTVRVGTTGYGSYDLYDEQHTIPYGEAEDIAFRLSTIDGYEGDVYIDVSLAGTGADPSVGQRFMNLAYIGLFYDQPPISGGIPPLATPYASEDLAGIQYVQNPHVNTGNHTDQAMVVFTHPNYFPRELVLTDIGNWEFRLIAFTEAAKKEDDPHWFDDPGPGGYPRAVGSSAGRVVFGGTDQEPQSNWASEPGNWRNISMPEGDPVATSPVHYTLTAVGAMQWILGYKRLLHGTVNGEHIIDSEGAFIWAGDLQGLEQSRYGAAHVQAELVGDEVFYISGDGRKVRKINFDDNVQGWRSIDMTFTSPEITTDAIRRISFSKDPQQVLWLPLNDGSLVGMTYEPGLGIHGWHHHHTDGVVLDLSESRYEGFDWVMTAVRRHVNNQDNLYLESMRRDPSFQQVYMDSYVRRSFEAPTTVVDGLEHLEGKPVTAVGIGNTVLGDYAVENGSITLDAPVTDVAVGLPYTARFKTLPAPPVPKNGSDGARRNWSRIGVRLVSSSLPMVNGFQYQANESDTQDGLITGDAHGHHVGWSDWGQITVEEQRPVPLNLIGIFGKLDDEDL